jgi:Transposase DDE domain group 1
LTWCEGNRVGYVFGLARNERLVGAIADELAIAEAESLARGGPARRFADLAWRTLDSWSRERRVVTKAEHLPKGPNPRFIVTSLAAKEIDARTLYEDVYCARGQVENRMYGRLPPCKQVSSSFRHAWSAAAMYPASLAARPRASMSSASWLPIIKASSKLFGSHGLCQPRSDRHVIASKNTLAACGGLASPASPRHRSGRRAIGFAAAQHCPDHPGELIGHRRYHHVERAAGEQRVDPCPRMALAALGEPHQRSRAVHQLATQIAVAALADSKQPLLATGGVLTRRQTEPGGKASAAAEEPGVADRGDHGGGDDRSDSRSFGQPPAGFILARLPDQALVEAVILASIWCRCSTCRTRSSRANAGNRGSSRSEMMATKSFRPAPR